MILIISDPNDLHAKYVAKHLKELGYEAKIFDLSDFGAGATITHPIHVCQAAQIRNRDGTIYDMSKVRTVWYRRPARPQPSFDLMAPDDINFTQREWSQAIEGLMLSLDAFFVNPVWAQKMASKPHQLETAQRIGLKIPDTLISSDPKEIEKFLEKHDHRVIHKSMTPHKQQGIYAQKWRASDYAWLENVNIAPTIFQEEIVGPSDIRVTIVGEKSFAARIATDPDTIDSRLHLDTPYEAWNLPVDVEQLLFKLMKELSLVFGCIDMRITCESEYVFFEVNPQGQFLYIEIWTGLPISKALAEFLGRSNTRSPANTKNFKS